MKTIAEQVSEFFGCPVSEKIFSDGQVIDALLETSDIEDLIPERQRAFFSEKAVILSGNGHPVCIVKAPITEMICEGHMPEAPIMPLAMGAWMLTQCGEILISYANAKEDHHIIPLVIKSGTFESKNRDFIKPGDCLILVAKLTSRRFNVFMTDTEAWLCSNQVVLLPQVVFATMTMEDLRKRTGQCETIAG